MPFWLAGPRPRELPSPATRSLREGSGATRPRHLMLFPAGGRRAEKSETPPSTSASRPRGQSTKGGGRRERGRSRRGQSYQGREEAASALLGTRPLPATCKGPAGVQALPLAGPTLHLEGPGANLPGVLRDRGTLGPLQASHGEAPEAPGPHPSSLTTLLRVPSSRSPRCGGPGDNTPGSPERRGSGAEGQGPDAQVPALGPRQSAGVGTTGRSPTHSSASSWPWSP